MTVSSSASWHTFSPPLLMGTCRQCDSWSITDQNHRNFIGRDPICASLAQSPSCDCGQQQTMSHIVDMCPLTIIECGLLVSVDKITDNVCTDKSKHMLTMMATFVGLDINKLENCQLHQKKELHCDNWQTLKNLGFSVSFVHRNNTIYKYPATFFSSWGLQFYWLMAYGSIKT